MKGGVKERAADRAGTPEWIRPLGLVRLSLERPIAVGMLFLAILAMGIVTYLRLPLQLLPSEGFTGQSITIVVPYPNASPREVEEGIVRPIEEAVGRIPGVKQMTARASADAAQVRVVFHSRTDIHLAQADLKEQLERVKSTFPEGADRYFLYRFDMDTALPVLFAGILIDPETEGVQRRVDEVVVPRLERIDGVARVSVFGLRQREVRIEIDRDAVSALGIPLYDVVQRLTQENQTLSVGDVEDAGRRYLVRAMGKFRSLEEIERFPIRPGLHLADVARIRMVEEEQDVITRVNGVPAAFLVANKESAANTVEVCRRLDEGLEELNGSPDLQGFTFHSYFDQGSFIEDSIGVLRQTALYGGALALLVLLLFMKRVGLTLTVALSIPLSILLALVAIFFTGGTLNVFSMMGLTLGIGMLVDNSIVVAENIDRLRRTGRRPRLAALLGPSQVGLAIVLSTATTAVVFVPLIFLGEDSNTRVMMREIGLPVIYALAASLFVALVFVPLAVYRVTARSAPHAVERRPRIPVLAGALRIYDRILPWVLHRRLETNLLVVIPFLLTTGFAFQWVKKTADLGGDNGRFGIDLEFPANLSLADADELVRDYESRLEEKRDEAGFEFLAVQFGRRGGDIDLFFDRDAEADPARLRELLRECFPPRAGVRVDLGDEDESQSREAQLRLLVTGPDSEVLAGIAREIASRLESVEGLEQVRLAIERDTQELRVGLERDLARRYAVNPQEVLGLVAYSLRGARLPDFETGRETLEVWARFREEDRESVGKLENLRVPTPDGGSISLSTVASFERARGYRSIQREDRKTIIPITARYADEDQSRVNRRVQEALSGIALPRGYGLDERGGFQDFREAISDITKALVLAVVFVFLLMGILFESFVLPLSVLLAIPFAIFGGMWALVATRTPLDVVAMVGFIVLAGVVVNNAIVLIDAINQLRRDGMERTEAIRTAARNRFRPIWMTALTTILGLLPMALREGSAEGVSYLTMARAVIGGLLVATLFTLFIVPLFYTLFDDLGRFVRSFATGLLRRTGAPLETRSTTGTA